jgi:hypothetical protein
MGVSERGYAICALWNDQVRDLKRRKEELQAALSEARDQATVAYEEKLNTVRRCDTGRRRSIATRP